MMIKAAVFLAFLVSAVSARGNGSPACPPDGLKPGHTGTEEAPQNKLQLVSTITQSTESEDEYFVTFLRHGDQPIKGLLLHPRDGTEGEFTAFDDSKYKTLDTCLTHKNKNDVNVPQMVTFKSKNGKSPKFNIIIVEDYKTWWSTKIE